MAQAVIGISKDQVTASTAAPEFRLGTVGGYDDPTNGYQEFVYGRANGAVTGLGYVCVEETGFDFAMINVTKTTPGTDESAAAPAAPFRIERRPIPPFFETSLIFSSLGVFPMWCLKPGRSRRGRRFSSASRSPSAPTLRPPHPVPAQPTPYLRVPKPRG